MEIHFGCRFVDVTTLSNMVDMILQNTLTLQEVQRDLISGSSLKVKISCYHRSGIAYALRRIKSPTTRLFLNSLPRLTSDKLSILKRRCYHFDEIIITGCTESCQKDNFRCSQWCKFRQNDNISVSVSLLHSRSTENTGHLYRFSTQRTTNAERVSMICLHYNSTPLMHITMTS